MKVQRFFMFCLVILTILTHGSTLFAQEDFQKIIIKVEGLYCPFCAYGLEKHLKALDGFKAVQINIKEGTAEVEFQPGTQISKKAILQAVEDAGFDLDGIEWITAGPKP